MKCLYWATEKSINLGLKSEEKIKHWVVILLLFAKSFCEEKDQLKAVFSDLHTDYITYIFPIYFTSFFRLPNRNMGYLDIVKLF